MKDLTAQIKAIGAPKILVIGDIILDKYVSGQVNRISPEAPIQVLNVVKEDFRLGGAANVAHNLVKLGARVALLSSVGSDEAGRRLKNMLRQSRIDSAGVMVTRDKPTTIKTRLMAQHQQVLRVDQEKVTLIDAQIEKRFLSHLKKHIQDYQLMLISDYHKGLLTPSLIGQAIKLARRAKIKVIIDPKGRNYKQYRGATAITPNRAEAESITGINISDVASGKKAARELIKTLRLEFVAITLGENGICLMTRSGKYFEEPAQPLAVYDVTGAGDTVLAVLGLGVAGGLDYATILHLANLAAGIVVSKLGTAAVTRTELIKRGEQIPAYMNTRHKIKAPKQLARLLTGFRDQPKNKKKKIVFTNGCFDILHPGHQATLRFAKSCGDILVVGLNSDRSVRLIKGRTRPLFNQTDRGQLLSDLVYVDYVVVFNETTPLKLIRQLKPDILIKGADWRGKKVVGEPIVKSYGGKVVFAPLIPGVSTTELIKQLTK